MINAVRKYSIMSLLGMGAVAFAGVMVVSVMSQTSNANGMGMQYTTVCHETSELDASGKQSPSDVDDSIKVGVKLKSRDKNPLLYVVGSTVSNDSDTDGGSAEMNLVINPHPNDWTFDGFIVPVDANCKQDGDIVASFNSGADTVSVEPSAEDNALNPNFTEDSYKGTQAIADFPDSAWQGDGTDDHLDLLFAAICTEVQGKSGTVAGLAEMNTAGMVGIAVGLTGQTVSRCLAHSSLVTFVGVNPCTADEVGAASSADGIVHIVDIPATTVNAESVGAGLFEVSLTDDNNCTSTATIDISTCDIVDVDDGGC